IFWDGHIEHLPNGWDGGLTSAFLQDVDIASTLLVLAGVVAPTFQGKGLSEILLNCFKSMAVGQGFTHILVPVRPTGKTHYPQYSFTEWCKLRRADGQLQDNWLRLHERVGGKHLTVNLTSQFV